MLNIQKKNIFYFFCIFIITSVILIGVFAPYLATNSPIETSIRFKNLPISMDYPFGTDHLGRCIFSRLIFGIRTTVFYAISAMALTLTIGIVIGMAAGIFQGKIDACLMRLCDVMLSFPSEVMILALVGILSPGIENILIAIVISKWAWYARMVRGTVMQYQKKEYVTYSKIIGSPSHDILKKHLIPMTASEISILASVDIGSVILMISALSFLGLGVQAPTPEWGAMLSEAKNVLITNPQQMLPAGLMIVAVIAAFNGLGDFLRDILDPLNKRS